MRTQYYTASSVKTAAALLVAFFLLPIAGPAGAAEKSGRLTVHIEVQGAQSWKAARDYGSARIAERYRFVIPLVSDGEPSSVNPVDPGYAAAQIGKAAQVQREAMKRQGAVPPPPAATLEDAMARQQALLAEAEQERAACKDDMNCLMQLAMRLAQQSTVTAYPGAAGDAAAATDADEEERFLHYAGHPDCAGEIDIRVDNVSEGAYADVGGMVPFTDTKEARYAGNEIERSSLCLSQQLVYDVKEDRIFMPAFTFAAARGLHRRTERWQLRTSTADVEVGGFAEMQQWVAGQLRRAAASGSGSVVLPSPDRPLVGMATAGAAFEGGIEVRLRWRFEPE